MKLKKLSDIKYLSEVDYEIEKCLKRLNRLNTLRASFIPNKPITIIAEVSDTHITKEIAALDRMSRRTDRISTYRQKRLEKSNLKECSKCRQIVEYFGDRSYCNSCQNVARMKSYSKNKDIEIARYIERLQTDILFKLKANIRSRLNQFIRRNMRVTKTKGIIEYLGCTMEELKRHLSDQFTPGMSWDTYGKWHIDHIEPLSRANTTEEMYKLSHYTNLQPLWAKDNIKKGGFRRPKG